VNSLVDTIIRRGDQPMQTGDVASLVGVSTLTIHRAIKAGKLGAWRTPGGHYRVQGPALLAFLAGLGRLDA
jgi:excisionase family DNA binding protein